MVYPVFLMKALCFALFACAFNLLIGFGGLLSFGHAMFLGMAGYVSAHAAKVWGLPPELAILAGTAAATLLGVLAGLLAIRRQGIYFAMITLALAQMVYFFCLQAPFTGGEDGIQSVPRGKLLGLLDLHGTIADVLLRARHLPGGFLLIHRIIHSPVRPGAQGDPRERAARHLARLPHGALQARGVRAVGGARRAWPAPPRRSSSSSPRSPTCTGRMSGEVVLMTLLGGMGTVFGPVVGAFVIVVDGELPGRARRLGHDRAGRRSSWSACSPSAAASSASSRPGCASAARSGTGAAPRLGP